MAYKNKEDQAANSKRHYEANKDKYKAKARKYKAEHSKPSKKTCQHCGLPARVKYCSTSCQQEAVRQARVMLWLETGEGVYSSSRRHWMRLYVLEDQHGLCDICGCSQVHNGQPLVFVLDHISGNASDHSRENLRMVCPNCDSQLSTYKGRNKGHGTRGKR